MSAPAHDGTKNTPSIDVSTQEHTTQSPSKLLSRISDLERQLREQTALLALLTSSASSAQPTTSTPATLPSRRRSRSHSPRRVRPFDPSLYSTRHIALKFAYLGASYGGFEHANGNITPQPTIEEVLWKALRKARLISPAVEDGADSGFDVLWGVEERRRRYVKGGGPANGDGKVRLDLNWEGCQYSKCGRTDRGVSAFGQVIGIRVRSNRPVEKTATGEEEPVPKNGDSGMSNGTLEDDDMPAIDTDDLATDSCKKPFDPIRDELPYISLLNSILPPSIRILAWCPSPPPNFDARFSCRERRYKYFFTNPAFCPTPGALGMLRGDGKGAAEVREGWLDVEKMKLAAKKLEGLHDFRNLCKIDASKQMSSCVRRVTFADVVEWDGGARNVVEHHGLNQYGGSTAKTIVNGLTRMTAKETGPKVYTFCVHGTAFLWHQVRCMAAVLFLIGQGLEEPSIIDELLDIDKNPGRPMYEMADDAPLVLWDCIFPDKDPQPGEEMADSLDWLYAGDEATIPSLTTSSTKSDGKFGTGAVVDELWTQWRDAKMQEVLAGSLLDLAISQGDGSSFERGATRDGHSQSAGLRTQKVFDGSSRARIQGRYVSVMNKPKMDSLEVLNAKWLKSRNARRAQEEADARGRDSEETNAEGE
ncbi:pseudouridine synthase deg1 [Cladophialophora chaetospira]|uniref:Pseudouridine synthase deg1 n=1 Tax=Cladophialophora chaetospira TaxID=386627 RepID=A0AA38XBC5_9EURO|nr:pseudouridine synthase deg1 [Cladophialophora chaetospira]